MRRFTAKCGAGCLFPLNSTRVKLQTPSKRASSLAAASWASEAIATAEVKAKLAHSVNVKRVCVERVNVEGVGAERINASLLMAANTPGFPEFGHLSMRRSQTSILQ